MNDVKQKRNEERKMNRLTILLVVVLTTCGAHAYRWTDPNTGYVWAYVFDGDGVEVRPGLSPDPTGYVEIPAMIDGKPVTSIGFEAFSNCSNLTNMTMPNSVTNIGGFAFGNCSALESMTIPNSVTNIGGFAFGNCSALASMTIPNSVMNIDPCVFEKCTALTSVTISDGVPYISKGMFFGCTNLTSVTIGNSVTSIVWDAFSGCSGLTEVTIPNSVTNIGIGAFRGCSSLTSIVMSTGIMGFANVGSYAFCECTNIAEVVVPGWRCEVPFDNVTNLVISAGTSDIWAHGFYGCSNLARIVISDSVTNIGSQAFYACNMLREASLPDTLEGSFDRNDVFGGCPEDLNIVYRVVRRRAEVNGTIWVYEVCDTQKARIVGTETALTGNVVIPSELGGKVVVALAESALKNAHDMTGVVIPKSVTRIEDGAFAGLEEVLAQWYRALAELATAGASYGLGGNAADKTVASITVDEDTAIGDFVLTDGKAYDSVVHVVNVADHVVRIILPDGHTYRILKGSRPLTVPAHSECLLTITRLSQNVFLVTAAELEVLQ